MEVEVYERLDILSVVWEAFVRVMLFVCCWLVWKTFVAVILFTGLDTMAIRLNEDWNKKTERKIKPYIYDFHRQTQLRLTMVVPGLEGG